MTPPWGPVEACNEELKVQVPAGKRYEVLVLEGARVSRIRLGTDCVNRVNPAEGNTYDPTSEGILRTNFPLIPGISP